MIYVVDPDGKFREMPYWVDEELVTTVYTNHQLENLVHFTVH